MAYAQSCIQPHTSTPKGKTMSNFDPLYQHRKSIRLKGYDYSSEGFYFITIVCHNRQNFFGIINNNDIALNEFGYIVKKELLYSSQMRQNMELHDSVIMPNHIHAIIEINKKMNEGLDRNQKFISPKKSLGAMVRGFKGSVTRQIRELDSDLKNSFYFGDDEFRVFQRNYFDRIIRNEKEFNACREYIFNNPRLWDEDKCNNA